MSRAGNFAIEVSGPSPIWCRLYFEKKHVGTFTHNELTDLIYTAQKALEEAHKRLTPDEFNREMK